MVRRPVISTARLGRSGLVLPRVTFGAWAIGGWYWGGTDDTLATEAIQAAVDAGAGAIDTAPVYGFGHSEQVVGRAIAGRRDQVLVLTKAGLRWDCEDGAHFFDTADGKRVYRNLRPDSLRLECDRSLARLGVDCIDLFQCHWPDPTTPIAESMGALLDLRAAGKIRDVGVSNFTPAMMAEAQDALGDVPLASNQPRYSLLARDIEADVVPWCVDHEVGLIIYRPIEQGLLTGRMTADRVFREGDKRGSLALFCQDNRAVVNRALADLAELAGDLGATLAQLVIAWTLHRPGITAALVGARTADQVRENLAAAALVLTPPQIAAITGAFEGLDIRR